MGIAKPIDSNLNKKEVINVNQLFVGIDVGSRDNAVYLMMPDGFPYIYWLRVIRQSPPPLSAGKGRGNKGIIYPPAAPQRKAQDRKQSQWLNERSAPLTFFPACAMG